jgi:hypothetical protein
MAKQAIQARQNPGASDDAALTEAREELRRSREEVLRLRDLLIGKDAELGALRGRVAELEAGSARWLGLIGRVRSLVPSLVWEALARFSKRRG